MRPFKFFRSTGFPYVQPIKMQCSQAVHCNWLKIRKVTAPESRKTLRLIKFIYSEKATKFCEVFPLLLTTVHTVKLGNKERFDKEQIGIKELFVDYQPFYKSNVR